jgi:uncharacterized protein
MVWRSCSEDSPLNARNVVIVPRWAGHATSDWYPWFIRECSHRHGFSDIRALELPSPEAPTIDGWTAAISAALDHDALAETILVGHSVGCRALMHALARLPAGRTIGGLACVAGWWTVDRPWPTIIPWIEAPLDLDRVRAAAPTIEVIVSDNDPFTALSAADVARWEALGARVRVIHGGLHFNRGEEPAIRDALIDAFGERG